METPWLDVDSNCDPLVGSTHPYSKYLQCSNAQVGVMYNLFKPGSSFNLGLLDSDSCSSDPIRADCSLNDGVATEGLCSPKEDYFIDAPSKRSSIQIQIEDDEICELNHFPMNNISLIESGAFHQNLSVQSYVPNIPPNFELKESYCGVSLLVDNNLQDDNGIHGDFINPLIHSDQHSGKDRLSMFCANDMAKVSDEHDAQGKYKQSEGLSDTKPSLTASFMTMENSNNAIDNNLHASISVCQSAPSSINNCDSNNHIFKLPNTELTFNGTLKHLQKLQPIIDFKDSKEDFKYTLPREYTHKDESREYLPYKSSDEVTSNSSLSVSGSSSKSEITIFSSTSQFPSDCDVVSIDVPSKKLKFSDGLDKTSTNQSNVVDCNKAFTFAGTVSPLKSKKNETHFGGIQQNLSHNRSRESMDSSYNSGAQSPNIFSDDEDDYADHKSEADKADLILKEFEKCDKLLIRKLEKTLQGVLPPPSVTICQLTAVDILDRYKQTLAKFNNQQSANKDVLDPEASASMTPPRRISLDASSDPLLSNTLAMALENTVNQTFEHSMMSGQGNNTICADISNQASVSEGFIHLNGSEDIAMNEDWPQILLYRYHGVHYNSTPHSEDIDLLLSRYSSRYIGCETASSCVAMLPSTSTNLRTGVRRAGLGGPGAPSPGRRLSHLAKRRAAFCTAASLIPPTNRRQILIDRKKFGNFSASRSLLKGKSPRNRRTPSRRTPGKKTPGKKTPGKKTPGKKTPGSAQKKIAAKKLGITTELKIKSQPTRESSKRALFLSPENATVKPLESSSSAPRPSTSRAIKSKRALFGSPVKPDCEQLNVTKSDSKAAVSFNRTDGFSVDNQERKRNRLDDDFANNSNITPTQKKKKSLSFGGDKIGSNCNESVRSLTRRATEYVASNGELTDINKKKLLWAVAEALRAHGIGMSHESFKEHATSLVRLTRKLCTLPVHMRALKAPFSSTSDTLLKIARLHVFSVIKGKSVDELFSEEQIKQLNAASAKVTGYVPPGGYESNKLYISTALCKNSENSYGEVKVFKPDSVGSNKKTVLQDKTVNIDTKSNGGSNSAINLDLKKPSLFRDNNKLRARRQISFDNMEDPCNR